MDVRFHHGIKLNERHTVPVEKEPPYIQIITAVLCFLSTLGAQIFTLRQLSDSGKVIFSLDDPIKFQNMYWSASSRCGHASPKEVALRGEERFGGSVGGRNLSTVAYGIPRNWRTVGSTKEPTTEPCCVLTDNPSPSARTSTLTASKIVRARVRSFMASTKK